MGLNKREIALIFLEHRTKSHGRSEEDRREKGLEKHHYESEDRNFSDESEKEHQSNLKSHVNRTQKGIEKLVKLQRVVLFQKIREC